MMKVRPGPENSFYAENLIAAAKRLESIGRMESAEALFNKALNPVSSLNSLKELFEASVRNEAFHLAFRTLVYIDKKLSDAKGDEVDLFFENWSTPSIIPPIMDVREKSEKFPNKRLILNENSRIVGCIGPFGKNDDLEFILNSISKLARGGEDIKLLLVNDNKSHSLDNINELLLTSKITKDQPNITSWLISETNIPHEDLKCYYALMDVVVVPARRCALSNRLVSMKAVEALAYGKRVVVPSEMLLPERSQEIDEIEAFDHSSIESLGESLKRSLYSRPSTSKGMDALTFSRCLQAMVQPPNFFPIQLNGSISALAPEPVSRALSKEPIWFEFQIDENVPYEVCADLSCQSEGDISPRACIARVEYLRGDGELVPPPYDGLPTSNVVGPFFYLNVGDDRIMRLDPPNSAKVVRLGLQTWNALKGVTLNGQIQCVRQSAVSSDRYRVNFNAPVNAVCKTKPLRQLNQIKVATILDEFTAECFKHELSITAVTHDKWRAQLEKDKPDFLFVESCWFGNGNSWGTLIFDYKYNGVNRIDELKELIKYCQNEGIPTVFWSKEDPVHYHRFAPTAKLFDYVYTSDANMIPSYKKDLGVDAEPLSFFCQPRIHNPVELIERQNKAVFAGSYYSDKKERCENFHSMMHGLALAGIEYDIYDRCLERDSSHFRFPDYFQKNVVGFFLPSEMWRAYKGYRYTVNLNTVKNSPTMFARRVYESLASGTPVISNYSEGVITQFGGIVCASDNQNDIRQYLEKLKDPVEYSSIVARGVRETLGRHTLADRIESVCARLGILVQPHLPITNAIYTASTHAEVERVRSHFHKQHYHRKRLVVNLRNSNVLYPYLNRNTDDEIFRVTTEFAKPLNGVEVEMCCDADFPSTHLEDIAIRTQYDQDLKTTIDLKKGQA